MRRLSAPLTTVVLQRGLSGYAGASDTSLAAFAPNTPLGASDPLYLDGTNSRPLLRFSIFQTEGGPVPQGAVVQTATLELYKQYYDNTLQLNALLAPWSEAQSTWNGRQSGKSDRSHVVL